MLKSDKNRGLKIFAVVMAAICFLMVGAFSLIRVYVGSERYALQWMRNTVKKQYYLDFDEEFLKSAKKEDLFGDGGVLDIYSEYFTKEELAAYLADSQGDHTAFGISLVSMDDGAKTGVLLVSGNSPAENAGLKEGSYIHAVGDSESEVGLCSYAELMDILSEKKSGDSCVFAVSDDKDTSSADWEYITVTKSQYVENYVYYADDGAAFKMTGKNADELVEYTTYLPVSFPSSAAYIRLTGFMGDAATQFSSMLSLFKERGKKDLVLDLRNNGGGAVDILQIICSYLAKNAEENKFLVGYAEYKNGKKDLFKARGNYYDQYFKDDASVFVLANANTASASEALIGAMLDYGTIDYEDIYLTEVSGEFRSYGKGIMQTTIPNLLSGEAIKLTTARVMWPVSGSSIHGVGVTVEDGCVPISASYPLDYHDEALKDISLQLSARLA